MWNTSYWLWSTREGTGNTTVRQTDTVGSCFPAKHWTWCECIVTITWGLHVCDSELLMYTRHHAGHLKRSGNQMELTLRLDEIREWKKHELLWELWQDYPSRKVQPEEGMSLLPREGWVGICKRCMSGEEEIPGECSISSYQMLPRYHSLVV